MSKTPTSNLLLQSLPPQADGVRFVLRERGTALVPGSWPSRPARLPDGKPACLGPLLRLLDEDQARVFQEDEHAGILVPHPAIAAMERQELSCLGLPRPIPHVLQISGNGPISAPDFRFHVRYIHPAGYPSPPPARVGAFVSFPDGTTGVLPRPFFLLLEAVDKHVRNSRPELPLEERLALAGRVLDLLPENCRVDDTLRTIHVRWCDAFTLRPYRNDRDEPDFDPVPLVRPRDYEAPETVPEQALKGSRQQQFERYFRSRTEVSSAYPAGHGWYVVFSPRLQRALQCVRRAQASSSEVRHDFLRNPTGWLRGQLEDDLDEEALSGLFLETPEFSARVREIGAWQPPSVPFYTAETDWFPPAEPPSRGKIPPEDLPPKRGKVFRIGDVEVPVSRLPSLKDELVTALEEGRSSVPFEGQELPASRQVIRAIETFLADRTGKSPAIVLLSEENFEELRFREKVRRHDGVPPTDPASLVSSLLPHQREGVRWLQLSWRAGVPGVLLADDMGLGKTLQVLSLLAWLRETVPSLAPEIPLRFLVVCPTALVNNWADEIERHFNEGAFGTVLRLQGETLRRLRLHPARRRRELDTGLPVLDRERLRQAGMVITGYETLRDYQHSLGRIRWAVMVLDEAQRIKNPTSLVSGVARAMNAEFMIAVTGTPVENRMADLWSILDAIRPGRFGTLKEFCSRYENWKDPSSTRTRLVELGRELASADGDRPPVMVRRLKKGVIEGLPRLHLHRREQPMPEIQQQAYDQVLSNVRERRGRTGRGAVLQSLQDLRSVSLHPGLVRKDGDMDPRNSARISTLLSILDEVRDRGEKVLIFLDSRRAQDVLVDMLAERYALPTRPVVINGTVPGAARKDRIETFLERRGFDVLLLSPRAAGVGLNLVAANHVVHLERWWNPAVEDQATDRAYRIGQEKDVHVYLPLAIHPRLGPASFDHRLDALLSRKRGLHRDLLAPANASGEELFELLSSLLGGDERESGT